MSPFSGDGHTAPGASRWRGPVREPEAVAPATSPGSLLRRAQQVHTELWSERVHDVTGPQYAVLVAVAAWPDVNQRRAGTLASLDKSSIADVVNRLVGKGWLEQVRDPRDGRRRVLTLAPRSRELLPGVTAAAASVQHTLLAPLQPGLAEPFVASLGLVARIADADVAEQDETGDLLVMRQTPGYLIRRAQQVHTALWSSAVADVTGPQYAVLASVARLGLADQGQIGEAASLDPSSTAAVVRRLSVEGWLIKDVAAGDRRRAAVRLSVPGTLALSALAGCVTQVQDHLLDPLPVPDRGQFVAALQHVAFAGRIPGASA
jgi:DNA-binding MarR family transcriptional regulator